MSPQIWICRLLPTTQNRTVEMTGVLYLRSLFPFSYNIVALACFLFTMLCVCVCVCVCVVCVFVYCPCLPCCQLVGKHDSSTSSSTAMGSRGRKESVKALAQWKEGIEVVLHTCMYPLLCMMMTITLIHCWPLS